MVEILEKGHTNATGNQSTGVNYGNVIATPMGTGRDCWITGVSVNAGGSGGQTHAKLALWEYWDGPKMWEGPEQVWGNGADWHSYDGLSIRVSGPNQTMVGFWRLRTEPSTFKYTGSSAYYSKVKTYTAARFVPSLAGGEAYPGVLNALIRYVVNQRPLTPVFFGVTPSGGAVAPVDPVIQCTLPHDAREGGHDYTQRVLVKMYRTDMATLVAHGDPSALEYEQWVPVAQNATTLTLQLPRPAYLSTPYTVEVSHQDSWGEISPKAFTYFVSATGPDVPTLTNQFGKINAQKPTEFRGTYNHAAGTAFSRVQVEIYNEAGTIRLQSSGDLTSTITVTNGGFWSVGNAWMANLEYGRTYLVRARVKDSAGVYGGWGYAYITTNSAPLVPFNMIPSGGIPMGDKVLQATTSDPNGDPITSIEYKVIRKSDSVQVATGTMALSQDTLTGTVTVPALVVGVTYLWAARASDGFAPSPSAYSAWQEFTVVNVPAVNIVLPTDDPVQNLAKDPSFEYESTWWTSFAESADNTIWRINDAEAYAGVWSLRGEVNDFTQGSPIKRSAFEPVDVTRAYYFDVRMMREILSDPAATYFGVEAYNSSGTLLGTLYPGDLPEAEDVGTTWNERDGFIGPSAQGYATTWPVGTTQYRLMFEPSRGINSIVRLDTVMIRQLEVGVTFAQAQASQRWLGYFDGDTDSLPGQSDYTWEVITGNSIQRGLNVLEYPQTAITMNYTHPTGSLKSNDRLLIDRLVGTTWRNVYDSGWTGGGRTTIPLPPGLFLNKQRYRLKLGVTDSQSIAMEGWTTYIPFDTNYEGPDAPTILASTSDMEAATLTLEWAPNPDMNQLTFGGYEVAYAPYGSTEPPVIVGLVTNPETTSFTWHEPLNATDYYLLIRQIENIVGEQIQGQWARVYARVDYRKWFIKSLSDPDAFNIGFDLMAEDVVTMDHPKTATELLPWQSDKPVFYPDTRDQAVGQLIVRIDIRDSAAAAKDATLNEIRKRRRFGAVLLTTDPNDKFYVYLSTMAREFSDRPWYASWTVGFSEMHWEPDMYLREGLNSAG